MRNDRDEILCPRCERAIPGVTGLEELHNMIAHMAEHHEITLDLEEALVLRVVWERM